MNGFGALKIVEELLLGFASVLPNLLGAVLVLLLGWILSKFLARLVKTLLSKSGADKFAEKLNEIDLVHKSKVKIVPSIILSKVLYYFMLIIFVVAATDVLNMNAVSSMMNELLNYIPYFISAMAVFVLGVWIADSVKNLVHTTCKSLGIPAGGVIANVVFYFLFLNITMISLAQARINTSFIEDNISILLGGLVLAFAIGYGFASRPLVANFLAAIYSKKKIKIGDVISIEGVKGEIIGIDNTSIVIQAEGKQVHVPLNKLSTEKIEVFEKNN